MRRVCVLGLAMGSFGRASAAKFRRDAPPPPPPPPPSMEQAFLLAIGQLSNETLMVITTVFVVAASVLQSMRSGRGQTQTPGSSLE